MNLSEQPESENEFIPREIYCQSCGRNLTHFGGDVTNTGKVYCHEIKEDLSCCINKEISIMLKNSSPKPVIAHYLDSRDIQTAIHTGRLIKYGPLEEKTI